MILSNKEVLALLRIGLEEGDNTLVREGGFPVSAELTSIGGLLCGECHSISGMTAGETAYHSPVNESN